MRFQALVFILDGLGDRPCPQLAGQTPLQAAHTPTLDQLTQQSQCGLMDPLFPGVPVDTHTGVALLFGLPPQQAAVLHRGPVEAAGLELPLQPGDVLLRCNLASIEKHADGFRIHDRRAGRIDRQTAELCQSLGTVRLAADLTACVFPATQHRVVLRLRGSQLSAQISDTDPGGKAIEQGVLRAAATVAGQAAQQTAAAINDFTELAYTALDRHPINQARRRRSLPVANGILTRGAGLYQPLSGLLNQLALPTAVVAGENTILGLARLFGFSSLSQAGFTSLPNTDIAGKLTAAMQALHAHDLVFVHLKGTDTAAHDRNPQLKADFISRFDQQLGHLMQFDRPAAEQRSDLIIAVCADHSTDSISGEHNGDPVPVLLYSPQSRRDRVTQYDEIACIDGGLSRLTAQGFVLSLLDAMGVMENYKPAHLAAIFPSG